VTIIRALSYLCCKKAEMNFCLQSEFFKIESRWYHQKWVKTFIENYYSDWYYATLFFN